MYLADVARDRNLRGAEDGIISMVRGIFSKDKNLKDAGLEKFRFHARDYYLRDNAFAMDEIKNSLEIDTKKIATDKADTDRQLEIDADKYSQFLMHTYWELHDLGSIGVAEPLPGCPNCHDAYAEWWNRIEMKSSRPLRVDSKAVLDSLYDPMLWGKKPARLSGYENGDVIG